MATLLTGKSLKDDLAFVEEQLRRFPDPHDTVRFMWQQRKNDLQRQINELKVQQSVRGEVALLFEGEPVIGSEEIRLQFATRVLDNYQNLIAVLTAEMGGAELKAKGQVPRSFTSKLFIRDMLRGSVGFLLEEPAATQNTLLPSLLKEAIDEATLTLQELSAPDQAEFQTRVDALSPRAMSAIKKSTNTLNEAAAETRIVGSDTELRLGHERVARMHARLTEMEILETTESLEGILLGILPDRQQYEFRIGYERGPIIYGPLSEDLDQQYLTNPAGILLRRVIAHFLVVTTLRAGLKLKEERILERIQTEPNHTNPTQHFAVCALSSVQDLQSQQVGSNFSR